MDEAVIPGISAAFKYYNRDLKRDATGTSTSDFLYPYTPSNSFFKICDVGTIAKTNLWEAKDAGVNCKDMDLYKCISFCVLEPQCRFAFFNEGPMDTSLEEPLHFCAQMLNDFDLETEANAPKKFDSDFWKDLASETCTGDCTPCSHTTSTTGGISACTLKHYLETHTTVDAAELMPLMKKTGAKTVFMDHVDAGDDGNTAALKDIESK